jgi:hypothetical protein
MTRVHFRSLSGLVIAIAVASCAGQSCVRTAADANIPSQLICSNVPKAGVQSGIPVGNVNGTFGGNASTSSAIGSIPSGVANAGSFSAEGHDAFRQGASSVADLNLMKRGSMVSSALKNWQAPTEQQDAAATLGQNMSLADPFSDASTSSSTPPSPGGTGDDHPIKTAWDFTCYWWNPETDVLGTAADFWAPRFTDWAPKSGDSIGTVAMKVSGFVVGGTLLAIPAVSAVGGVAAFEDFKHFPHDMSILGEGFSQAGVQMNTVADQVSNGQTPSNQGSNSAQSGCAPVPSPSPAPANPAPNN